MLTDNIADFKRDIADLISTVHNNKFWFRSHFSLTNHAPIKGVFIDPSHAMILFEDNAAYFAGLDDVIAWANLVKTERSLEG